MAVAGDTPAIRHRLKKTRIRLSRPSAARRHRYVVLSNKLAEPAKTSTSKETADQVAETPILIRTESVRCCYLGVNESDRREKGVDEMLRNNLPEETLILLLCPEPVMGVSYGCGWIGHQALITWDCVGLQQRPSTHSYEVRNNNKEPGFSRST